MDIDNFFNVHTEALRVRAMRTKILATNIANTDTPNYKARDISFADTLKNVRNPVLQATHKKHLTNTPSNTQASIMYRQPNGASLDGNTVDKDAEQARFAENAIRYQASLEFISSRVGSIIRTLRGE